MYGGLPLSFRFGTLRRVAAAVFVILLIPAAAPGSEILVRGEGSGTSEDPYLVPRTACEISIDGMLEEDVWNEALTLSVPYEVEPGENVAAPVETEVMLAYDSDNLYAAFRCYDP